LFDNHPLHVDVSARIRVGTGIYNLFVRKNWFGKAGSTPSLAAASCKSLLAQGFNTSGVYWINANGALPAFPGLFASVFSPTLALNLTIKLCVCVTYV
jgi:hypothetical protein